MMEPMPLPTPENQLAELKLVLVDDGVIKPALLGIAGFQDALDALAKENPDWRAFSPDDYAGILSLRNALIRCREEILTGIYGKRRKSKKSAEGDDNNAATPEP